MSRLQVPLRAALAVCVLGLHGLAAAATAAGYLLEADRPRAFELAADKRAVKLRVTAHTGTSVRIDRDGFERALGNVLDNARPRRDPHAPASTNARITHWVSAAKEGGRTRASARPDVIAPAVAAIATAAMTTFGTAAIRVPRIPIATPAARLSTFETAAISIARARVGPNLIPTDLLCCPHGHLAPSRRRTWLARNPDALRCGSLIEAYGPGRVQSGYSSLRQARGSSGWALGVRSSREL
jgi:hypothetical protein